jgi:hypothetical protein
MKLVARPLIDDSAIFSYLNNRYQVVLIDYNLKPSSHICRAITNKQLLI